MISIVVNNVLSYASLNEIQTINGERVYIVPENVTEIDRNAFKNFKDTINPADFLIDKEEIFKVDKIILSNKITEIKEETFKNVQAQTIILPNSLQKINKNAFNKSGIEFITLPESLTYLGERAFYGCTNLKSINIPKNITVLNVATFKHCNMLSKVNLNDGLKEIKNECFSCSSLEEITIPNSVYKIESHNFSNCNSLKKVILPKNKKFTKLSDSLFDNCISLTSLVVPPSVKTIGSHCLNLCKSLTSITLPSKIKDYGISCFSNCCNLKEITLTNKNTFTAHIGEYAFHNCNNLETVNINGNFECSAKIFSTCSNLKYLNKDEEKFDFLNFNNVEIYLDDFDMLYKLKEISQTVQNKATIQYDFAYELYTFKKCTEFSHAYFKFYNRLKNKFITEDLRIQDKNKFDILCFNLGIFNENRDISNKAYTFLEEAFSKKILPVNKLGEYFSSMHAKGYKKDFVNFVLNKENFKKLMELEYQGLSIISEVYNNFENLQENHLSKNHHHRILAPTVEYFKEALTSKAFKFVDQTNIHIAEEISKFSTKQNHFDIALKVNAELEEMIINTGYNDTELIEDPFETIETLKQEILNLNANSLTLLGNIIENNFTYEWLKKRDPRNLMLGYYCSCCAHIGGAGDGIMRASIILPNVRNLVIKNEYNRIIAKATLYVNEKFGYGVFNTIQLSENITDIQQKEKIFEKFLKGAYAYIKEYNALHPLNPLKQVNVGLGLNSLSGSFFNNFKEAIPLKAINFSEYAIENEYDGDWQDIQYCIYNINEEFKKEPGEEDFYLNHD